MNSTGPIDLSLSLEAFQATLSIALLSAGVLIGLFFYLNRYTQRRYFTDWSVAWIFYALWLSLTLVFSNRPPESVFRVWSHWCIGVAAMFLVRGSLRFVGVRIRRGPFAWLTIFLLIWSLVGSTRVSRSVFEFPFFLMVSVAGTIAAGAFFTYSRNRGHLGAKALCGGFIGWSVLFACFPFWLLRQPELVPFAFFCTAILQLFIGISMIIIALEEVRRRTTAAQLQVVLQRAEKAKLRTKVLSTEERYRSLFDQASEGIIITRADDLKLLELNHTAARILGIEQAEATTHSLSTFCQLTSEAETSPQDGAAWFTALCEKRRFNIVGKSGAITPVELDGAAIDFEGQPAYQFFLREMTERSRLEQQLRQAEKLSALGQMISGVAHELNNPLAVVKGYLELILARHPLDTATRTDLEKVARESNRAANLVGHFLAFARGQSARREKVDINALIERVADLRKLELRVAGIEFSFRPARDVPPISADPDQLQQVLTNLITNAMHALVDSPPPRRLQISTAIKDDSLEIRIEDNGPGVPHDLEAKIFEPFFTTKLVGSGTGLGLSIAHSLIADHGGRIFYQTSAMGGAAFVVELPTAEGASERVHEIASPITESTPKLTSTIPGSAEILVLDDEQAIAELLCEMLTLLGHRTTMCTSPAQALEELSRRNYDAILSDYRMPHMNGQQFFREVERVKPPLARRIVFLTGDLVNDETQHFLQSIPNPHLTKPFKLPEVEAALASVLAKP